MDKSIDLGNLIIPIIKPIKGVDYFTVEEVQQMINEVFNRVNPTVEQAETARQNNETTRQNNEISRQNNENIRQQNEEAREIIKERVETLIEEIERKLDNGEFIGEQGVGITNISFSENYTIIIHLSDGTVYESGSIRGEQGERGEKGDTPERGVDYWTGEDKREIIQDVENDINIPDLQERLQDAEKNQLTGQSSGTSIDLSDSADSRVRSIELEGNSEQESTTGKNKLQNTLLTTNTTLNGITATPKSDGSVVLNGTATETTYFNLSTTDFGSNDFSSSQGGSTEYIASTGTSNTNIRIGYSASNHYSFIRIASGASLSNVIVYPMIRLASITDDTYEPYTGGQASPNPSYPQEIHSTGDNVNLFDGVVTSQSASSYEEGKITFNAGSGTNNQIIIFSKGECKENKTYTVSFDVVSNLNGVRFTFDGQPDNTTSSGYFADVAIYATTTKTRQTITGIIPDGLTGFRFFRTSSMDLYSTGTIEISNIKIEKGITASPYTPYGIGSVNEKVQNKNLFNSELEQNAWNNSNGTATVWSNQYVRSKDFIEVNGNTAYTINAFQSNTLIVNGNVLSYDENYSFITSIGFPSTMTFTTSSTTKYLKFNFYNASGITVESVNKIQLEQGTTATDYVAHEEQNISIPTQQPMRAIGEYKDTFVKVDGNWYERHYIGQVVLDGSESGWEYQSSYQRFKIPLSAEAMTSERSNSKSNYFIYGNTETTNGTFFIATNNVLLIRNEEYTSVADLKTWLSNNNVELIYVLATPVDLPCTEEQVESLEALNKARTYKPVTHISSEDTVPATVDLTYVKDLETVINNLGGA